MNDQCERCGVKLNSLIDYPDATIKVGDVDVKTDLCRDCMNSLCGQVKGFVKNELRITTLTCKDCSYFVRGDGKSGTCKMRPHVSNKRGGVQMINGKPRPLIITWSHAACRMFEKGGEQE